MSATLVPVPLPARIKPMLVSASCMLLMGSLSVLGRPGLEIWPLYFVAQWVLCLECAKAPSLGRCVFLATAWGLPLGVGSGIGAISWGVLVPLGIAFTVLFFLALPQAFLASFALRRARSGPLVFILVASGWTCWLTLGDFLNIPGRVEATALLAAGPELLLGARIVGASLLCGIVLGGIATSAFAWVRAGDAPLLYRLRAALQPIAVAAGLLFGLASLGRASAAAPVGELTVGVPQIDADSTYYQSRMTFPPIARAFERRLSEQLQQLITADLVVFTETYDGRFGLMLPAERQRLSALAKNRGQAWLVTSYLVEADGRKSNAAAALTKQGEWVGVHRKVGLAPYGERALHAGTRLEALDLRDGTRVGVVICNEADHTNIVRELVRSGANLLAASTSDITFGSSTLPFEHLGAARLQAIESGRDLVWASNGGPSAVLTRFGAVEHRAPFRAPATVLETARLYSELTPFMRHGALWAWLAGALVLAVVFVTRDGVGEPLVVARRWSAPGWAAIALGACSSILAVALPVLEPALVELRQGEARRARLAIPDLFVPKQTLAVFDSVPPGQPAQSSGAAAARLLAAYYGAEGTLAQGAAMGSLEAIGKQLESGFGLTTRIAEASQLGVPCVAFIVQLREGDFGVAQRPEGGPVDVYRPARQLSTRMSAAELMERTNGRVLLPAAPVASLF